MKRIAIFLDGTWNTTDNNTNVWRLRSLCDPNAVEQFVYYSKGVGTTFGQYVRGGTEGVGIDDEITDAYSWLCEHFELGDEIFVFGFSRGAYTARSLSGLIAKCGVLSPGAPLSIEQLYSRYRRRTDSTINHLLHAQAPTTLEERWLVKYCNPTRIKMVGVWDTVGSLGNPLAPLRRRISEFRFLDTHVHLQNEYAFQALAIDEQRKSFEPTLWTETHTLAPQEAPVLPRPLSQVEQRWFVGAHANVGGGYASDILAQPPLAWLMNKAAGLGLTFRNTFVQETFDPHAPITDSYRNFAKGFYRFVSRRFYRPIGTDPEKGTAKITSRINETIDSTVFDRWRGNTGYRPKNLVEWAGRRGVDPGAIQGTRRCHDGAIV